MNGMVRVDEGAHRPVRSEQAQISYLAESVESLP